MEFERLLDEASSTIHGLRAVLVVAMPDALLYGGWVHPSHQDFAIEDAAAYFGDLVRSTRQGLQVVGGWGADVQVTIEGSDLLVVLREMTEHFVCCTFFDAKAPLGMVRLHLKMLLDRITPELPQVDPKAAPRGVRLISFIERYAPDAHTVLLRLATRTGIPLAKLQDPARLDDAEVEAIEAAARRILGLESINV